MKPFLPGLIVGPLLVLQAVPGAGRTPSAADAAAIEKAVHASIGWALTKDRALLESVLSHDPDLFIFHPDSRTTVSGWEPMERLFRFWMDPRFRALRYEIRGLAIGVSGCGDAAWFSAVLDDCGEWDGAPSCWNDTRWTGVLEKRDGRWVIVQMHFSFARDSAPTGKPADGDRK